MQNVRARFVEGQGGVIFGPGGHEAVKVNVEGMTTAEAQRAVKAVIAALDAEFGQSSTSVRTGAQTAHQGGRKSSRHPRLRTGGGTHAEILFQIWVFPAYEKDS